MSKAKEEFYKLMNDRMFDIEEEISNYVKELEQHNEGLKCCGNCKWYYSCTLTSGGNICCDWENFTNDEVIKWT